MGVNRMDELALDRIELVGVGWNRVKWHEVEWDLIGCVRMGWNRMC